MQRITTIIEGCIREIYIPDAQSEVLPGVVWGTFDEFFTPAFWKVRLLIDGESSPILNYAIGKSLREEVAACLLGGFGMPAEVGLAAFERLRNLGMLSGTTPVSCIQEALRKPLLVNHKSCRYRYPNVKARYLAAAMSRMNSESPPLHCPLTLREWLLNFPGIGPKTASWITRNFTHTDEVAILDLHIVRAGTLMGLFSPADQIPRDYFSMEKRLLALSRALQVRLSEFDSLLWCYMRRLNSLALQALHRL